MSEEKRPALLDVNVLLALSWDQHIHHEAAHRRFAELDEWRTTPITESGLVRLLMTEAVVGRRVSGQEALGQIQALRAVAGWGWVSDDATLSDAAIDTSVLMGRRQVTDLHLVNLAARHELTIVTFDAALRECLTPEDQTWVEVWSA